MKSDLTNEQLMQAVSRDDRHAFAELVERLTDQVYGLAFRLLGNEQDARDAAQDTLVNIWQSRHRWSKRGAVSTWAYRITTNQCLNRLRSRKRWRLLSIGARLDDSGDTIDVPLPSENLPDIDIEKSEATQRLKIAIGKLPPRERAAILLRHDQGLSGKEVAAVLNTTVYGVDSLLFRARKRLRALLFEKK